jgi:hypothetical protein
MTTTTNTTALFHNKALIEGVAYSFSPCEEKPRSFNDKKVYLDILFVHPRTSEAIMLRTTTAAHMLYQPKDQIEHAVYREIRSALSFAGA